MLRREVKVFLIQYLYLSRVVQHGMHNHTFQSKAESRVPLRQVLPRLVVNET